MTNLEAKLDTILVEVQTLRRDNNRLLRERDEFIRAQLNNWLDNWTSRMQRIMDLNERRYRHADQLLQMLKRLANELEDKGDWWKGGNNSPY